ncbi:hypothetical protein O181_095579 [Austropuccinia psidii MF-1]|uniref:Integrase catalytic domain-containing protein n=1 Tax=Austropuccinia psidii MF-1 TaxID=1389203 RepID=A0A9Q3J5L1_9BASI|nr:hypothetical protein [Austropuccinia psidii MF-1]
MAILGFASLISSLKSLSQSKNSKNSNLLLKIKQVVTDNGGEFTSNEFKRLFEASGIQNTLTAPHTPQQNPFAERANRSLLERTRCLLLDSKLPHQWWGESISTATYLLNRTPVASLLFRTPFELLFGKKPKIPNLHPFGCLVYINIDKCNISSKLTPRANKGLFLGYLEGHKNFKVFNFDTGKYQVTHDCLFLDDCPGYPHFLDKASPNSISPFYLERDLLIKGNNDLCFIPSSSEIIPCSSPNHTPISSPISLTPVPCTSPSGLPNSPSLISKPPNDSCSAEFDAGEVDKSLPKGWVMDYAPSVARKDISFSINQDNILNYRRNQSINASVVPKSYHQALMNGSRLLAVK